MSSPSVSDNVYMVPVWEFQIENSELGWKGWKVTILHSGERRTYSFDERDNCFTSKDAVDRAFREADFKPLTLHGLRVRVVPIGTLVSAEISPN
jgi:hypothetical protein